MDALQVSSSLCTSFWIKKTILKSSTLHFPFSSCSNGGEPGHVEIPRTENYLNDDFGGIIVTTVDQLIEHTLHYTILDGYGNFQATPKSDDEDIGSIRFAVANVKEQLTYEMISKKEIRISVTGKFTFKIIVKVTGENELEAEAEEDNKNCIVFIEGPDLSFHIGPVKEPKGTNINVDTIWRDSVLRLTPGPVIPPGTDPVLVIPIPEIPEIPAIPEVVQKSIVLQPDIPERKLLTVVKTKVQLHVKLDSPGSVVVRPYPVEEKVEMKCCSCGKCREIKAGM